MKDERELIWVSKQLANEFNSLDEVCAQEKLVKSVIAKKGLDLSNENELLEENLLQFKSVCLAHKKELEKVYKEENDKLYKMWEEMSDISSKVRAHSEKLALEITPVRKEIQSLTDDFRILKAITENLNIYGADRLLDLARTVSQLDAKSKDLLAFMVNSYSLTPASHSEQEK